MFCRKCGKKLKDGAKFCYSCGTPVLIQTQNKEAGNNIPDNKSIQGDKAYTFRVNNSNDNHKISNINLTDDINKNNDFNKTNDINKNNDSNRTIDINKNNDSNKTIDINKNNDSNRTIDINKNSNFNNNENIKSKKNKIVPFVVTVLVLVIIALIAFIIINNRKANDNISTDETTTIATTRLDNTEAWEISNSDAESGAYDEIVPTPIEIDTTPFYGIWCDAYGYDYEDEISDRCIEYQNQGFTAEVVNTCQWDNLNSDNCYIICAGSYATESEANTALTTVLKYYSTAYVKYSGNYISNSSESSNSEWIIPDSDQRYLTDSDLDNLSAWEICLARNELYARRGYHFQTRKDVKEYFASCSWYSDLGYDQAQAESNMNEYELANRDFIISYEKAHGLNQ